MLSPSFPLHFGQTPLIPTSAEKNFLGTLRDNHHVLRGNPSIELRVRQLNRNNPFEGKSPQQITQLLNREKFFLRRRVVVNGHSRKLGVFVNDALIDGYNHRFYLHHANSWDIHREVIGPHVDHYISGDGIGRKIRRGIWEAKYRYPMRGGRYVTPPHFSGHPLQIKTNGLNVSA